MAWAEQLDKVTAAVSQAGDSVAGSCLSSCMLPQIHFLGLPLVDLLQVPLAVCYRLHGQLRGACCVGLAAALGYPAHDLAAGSTAAAWEERPGLIYPKEKYSTWFCESAALFSSLEGLWLGRGLLRCALSAWPQKQMHCWRP